MEVAEVRFVPVMAPICRWLHVVTKQDDPLRFVVHREVDGLCPGVAVQGESVWIPREAERLSAL